MADLDSHIQSKCYQHRCNRDEHGLYDNDGSATEDIAIRRRWTEGRHRQRPDAVICGRVSDLQDVTTDNKGSREMVAPSICGEYL